MTVKCRARSPRVAHALRRRVGATRGGGRLFDSPAFAARLERAWACAWDVRHAQTSQAAAAAARTLGETDRGGGGGGRATPRTEAKEMHIVVGRA